MRDILRKYGEAATFDFSLFEVDGVDLRVDAAHASGDSTVMKNEGTPASTTNGFVDEGDTYSITLTATEMECARGVIKLVDLTATKVWLDITIEFETYGHASAQHAFDLDTATQDVEVTAMAANVLTATAINGDAITAAKIADNAFIAANFAADSLDGKGDWNTIVPPTEAQMNARTIVSADYFDPAADDVAVVTDISNAVETDSASRTASKATGFSTHSAADIWAVTTRTLSSFGTLIADIWTNISRTITGTVTTDTASRDASKADVSALALEASITELKGSGFIEADDSNEAIRNRGDAAWVTGAGGSSPTVEEIRTEMDNNSTKLIDIVEDTNELQTDDIPTRLSTIDGNIASIPTVMRGTDSAALSSALVTHDNNLGIVDGKIDLIPTTAMRGTDGANTAVPDVAGSAAALHGVTDGKIDAVQIDVTESLDYLAGTWTIVNNQLIHYAKAGGELHRFNLTKAGVPGSVSPDARTRV